MSTRFFEVFSPDPQRTSCRACDAEIEFGDGAHLMMNCDLVLREGPLGTTALSVIHGVRDTFPGLLLWANECKWAIHERVDWPK
jgi:hypothetical protein